MTVHKQGKSDLCKNKMNTKCRINAWKYYLLSSLLSFEIFRVGQVNCHVVDGVALNLVVNASTTLFFPSAAISLLLCSKSDDQFTFSRSLSKNDILHNYLSFDDFHNIDFPLHQTIIFLDLKCPRASEVLLKANNSEMFSAPYKWIILQDVEDLNGNCTDNCVLEQFKSYNMYPDSNVLILQKLTKKFIRILSIYRPSSVRNMIVENLGHWSSTDGMKWYNMKIVSHRRKNLQKTPLKSSLVITNPDTLNHLTDYQDKHIDTITKCNFVWLHHLVDAMNATVTYSTVNTWGYRDKNGSWTGMTGQLSRKEIDFGGTSMFIIGDRWNEVHFIPLSTPTQQKFIFRQPPLSFVSNLFTLPFRRSVWIAIGVFLLLIFVMLFLAIKWEWRKTYADREFSENEPEPTLSDQILLIIGVCAQQGFGRSPHTVPSRVVLLMLLLAVLNLYASYSANIVALLQSTTMSIRTLKDLLESPIKCGANDIVYNRHYFKIEKDPVKRAIIEKKIEPKGSKPNWMTPEEGIAQVRQGFFAFLIETGPGYKILQETFEEDEKCGFREMNFIDHFDPLFAIVKRSPLQEIIRVNSLKIWESGLKSREVSRFYTKRPSCNGRNKFVSVGISECYFAFYIIGSGMLFAILLFLVEIIWWKSERKYASTVNRLKKMRSAVDAKSAWSPCTWAYVLTSVSTARLPSTCI
ncbi:ionotropic receptor 75a-like [Phymastichus coffea]|uniref:ionotropic receptor 75a-like n=1 Tax=Phymastichus coffea TaxID=108790 RepID=UPI00273CBD01|nr:ionotropic receptor 75a-like [Phymastichus coffea]